MAANSNAQTSMGMIVTGWIVGLLPVLALGFSAVMKLLKLPPLIKGFGDLGWPERLILPLGILEISCAIIYLIPRTACLGAVLMTGYLGGAIATHLRLGQPFFLQAGLGVLVWLGLYFRDARVRELMPLRKK